MTKNIFRRGNSRGGVFIAIEDARRWCMFAWLAYSGAVNSAKKACAMYKEYGDKFYREFALHEMEKASEYLDLFRALAGPRMVYREEKP